MKERNQIRRTKCTHASQRGFTLLEVLVALVIIAIGLLGIAGMNAVAINNTSIARTRSLAVVLGESLSAAMSANQAYWGGSMNTGVATSFTPPNSVSTSGTGTTLSDTTLNGKSTDCASAACTADAMAAYDLKAWGQTVASQLPGGTGTVACTTSSRPFVCKITISWSEKKLSARQKSGTLTSADMVATQTYETVIQP